MITITVYWQELVLMLVGMCLGALGSLYLIYELCGRSEAWYRLPWVFSSAFLFALLLLVSFLLFFGPNYLMTGYVSTAIWRLIGLFSFVIFIVQIVYPAPGPSSRFPGIDWSRFVFWMVLFGLAFVVPALVMEPLNKNVILVVLFALPGSLAYGAFHGFAPTIHTWILHLPEKRVAILGSWLIGGAFVLMVVWPLVALLGILL